jgi:hypothetical protein
MLVNAKDKGDKTVLRYLSPSLSTAYEYTNRMSLCPSMIIPLAAANEHTSTNKHTTQAHTYVLRVPSFCNVC